MSVRKKLVMFFLQLLKYSQKSCVFEHNKKNGVYHLLLQYWHVGEFFILIFFIQALQAITLLLICTENSEFLPLYKF